MCNPGQIRERAWPSPARGGDAEHAFLAGVALGRAGRGPARKDTALLTVVSAWIALGAATVEQFNHPAALTLGRWPGLECLRADLWPKLAASADRTDPVAVQAAFAAAMLAADPVTGVYYVDDRLHPLRRAETGRESCKKKRARRGEATRNSHVTAHHGRRGLLRVRRAVRAAATNSSPRALAELTSGAWRGDQRPGSTAAA